MKDSKQVQVEQLAADRGLRASGVTKAQLNKLSAKQINKLWCRAYGQQRFGLPLKNRDLSRFAEQIKTGKITNWHPGQAKRQTPIAQLLLF